MNETLLHYLISHVENLPETAARVTVPRMWNSADRDSLLKAVKEYQGSHGGICWQTVADSLEGRTAQCCRCQYYAIMRSDSRLRHAHGIKQANKWSYEDTAKISELIDYGKDINAISEAFPSYSRFYIRNKVNYIKNKLKRFYDMPGEVISALTYQ